AARAAGHRGRGRRAPAAARGRSARTPAPRAEGSGMRHAFEYALLRIVPRIERGERLNAGVILYCRALAHLGAAVHLDPARLAALDPAADPIAVGCVLDAIVAQCAAGTRGVRYPGPAGAEGTGSSLTGATP